MLVKILVSPYNILLLDEPTNHLDLDSSDSLLAAIDAFEGAVVIVTHNEMFLRSLANRFIVFDRGRIREYNRSYDDFLEEIGWELDERLRQRETETDTGKPQAPAMDKKALRQARARIVQERSRVAGPLEKKVDQLEEKIESLEKGSAEALEALEAASVAGDGDAIAASSRRLEQAKRDIESAFDALEEATKVCDLATRKYDDLLDELSTDS
jgi:ATP-binding cassette subfamily F protein 3